MKLTNDKFEEVLIHAAIRIGYTYTSKVEAIGSFPIRQDVSVIPYNGPVELRPGFNLHHQPDGSIILEKISAGSGQVPEDIGGSTGAG